jgi:hypothetical protein
LAWEAEGWEKFMGRPPTSADFLFPREDGKQRLVSGTTSSSSWTSRRSGSRRSGSTSPGRRSGTLR